MILKPLCNEICVSLKLKNIRAPFNFGKSLASNLCILLLHVKESFVIRLCICKSNKKVNEMICTYESGQISW